MQHTPLTFTEMAQLLSERHSPRPSEIVCRLRPSGDLPSKTKCRNALKSVNVNICQFLDCENKPNDVNFFKSRNALVRWTKKNHAFFPKRNLPQGSPLRTLLKLMLFGKP
ncbi:hypothetical protein NW752_003874 [Fusarium irregulare]|nr:hypothetical protein NW752_003874 [Fusarium irregulare]